METIDVELGEFTLRARSVLLSHISTALSRGLEPGERVILRDSARGHFSAHVADIAFEPADTIYRLELGVRLSAEEAAERQHAMAAPLAGDLTKQDLLDLLGELRSAGRTLPAGRRRRESRTDTAL